MFSKCFPGILWCPVAAVWALINMCVDQQAVIWDDPWVKLWLPIFYVFYLPLAPVRVGLKQ
jgi:hypothetical protein